MLRFQAEYSGSLAGEEAPGCYPTQSAKPGANCQMLEKADPHRRPDGPRMNPLVSVGNPPRPFRLFRMAERSTPDPSSSRVPVHSALVQKSVTTSTNVAGRLFVFDARKEFAAAQEEKHK